MDPARPAFDPFDPLRDLAPTALALSGLRSDLGLTSSSPRAPIEHAASMGYRAVVLDATAPGLRPRDLDRSARRDLASLLRRLELVFAGLDLWIPPEHFAGAEHADRAANAAGAAADLAADLGRDAGGDPVVSLTLPRGLEGDRLALFVGVVSGIAAHAERAGATIADHGLPLGEAQGATGGEASPIALGVDPAGILLRDEDPVALIGARGSRVRVARWTDADTVSRLAPAKSPRGRLDVMAYAATVAATTGARRLVADFRGVPTPLASAAALARTLP